MFSSFIKFLVGFTLLIILGIGALALTSYASPYLDNIKATVIDIFK